MKVATREKNSIKPLFVTGIGTGVGKTIVSAIITEQLRADYWKPVQAGDLDNSDSDRVKSLISNSSSRIHPEQFRLKLAASPDKAAALEGITIKREQFVVPKTANRLIIEGAGGLMVPLSANFFMIDLIKLVNAEVVLVVRNYLGCINHTLLSYELLRMKGCTIKGLVFNGVMDEASKLAICNYLSDEVKLYSVPEITPITNQAISQLKTLF
jgi:dethiobiotin synthetase